jgi:hypothetical protein
MYRLYTAVFCDVISTADLVDLFYFWQQFLGRWKKSFKERDTLY